MRGTLGPSLETEKKTQESSHGRERQMKRKGRWFCLNTDGEGGEEVGAESVRVEGESVVDESCAEIV